MKVGTDGVLLGAWTNVQEASTALDIGCGTGLIALMLAQRAPSTTVVAVELDEAAADEARLNVSNSSFAQRIEVVQGDVREAHMNQHFDLIVSNPPFYNGTYAASGAARNQARHQNTLGIQELAAAALRLGKDKHRLAVVLPKVVADENRTAFTEMGYHLSRQCSVKPTPEKPVHRVLQEWSSEQVRQLQEEELIIEHSRHEYSKEYRALCRDFYLKF